MTYRCICDEVGSLCLYCEDAQRQEKTRSLTLDFSCKRRSGLDTTTPNFPKLTMENSNEPPRSAIIYNGINLLKDNIHPSTIIVKKLFQPLWSEYIHTYNYNYSITINIDPKASFLINKDDRITDEDLRKWQDQQEFKRLKLALSHIMEFKLVHNLTMIQELGEGGKRHYHFVCKTARITALRNFLEKIFETSLASKGKGWSERKPINRIRPKLVAKPDLRTLASKEQEVRDAIDYIIHTYYQKERYKFPCRENLLFNWITKK